MNADELEYYKVRDSSHIKIIKEQADRIVELEKECAALREQLRQMESQVYGGTTQ